MRRVRLAVRGCCLTALVMGSASCTDTRSVFDQLAVDTRCRSSGSAIVERGDDQSALASGWTPKAFEIAARGRYTPPFPGDKDAVGAKVIKLSSIGLSQGDYVGLRTQGGYRAWSGDGNLYSNVGALFRDSRGKALVPSAFGQEEPFEFWSGTNGAYGVMSQDFLVPVNRIATVRVPKGAAELAFSTGDWFVGDNCPPAVTSNYGAYTCPGAKLEVVVSEPNKPAAAAVAFGPPVDDEVPLDRLALPRLDVNAFPEARGYSASPFSTTAAQETDGQWRGNYQLSGWSPRQSKYGAARPTATDPGHKHWGWDIFAPFDTKLIAPVWPAELEYMDIQGYGLSAVLGFKVAGKPYVLIYGHLNRAEGANRTITSAEIIGRAGCSGNAQGPGCSYDLPNGTRLEHVHVGLFRGTAASSGMECDPAIVLNWSIR